MKGEHAQFGVEAHSGAALLFPVKEIACLDAPFSSFEAGFERDGLGAELDFIRTVCLGASALVFDREEGAVPVDFDHIAKTAQTVFIRPHRETTSDAHSGAAFTYSGVRLLVEGIALGGRSVLCPESLHVNQRALPGAIQVVL